MLSCPPEKRADQRECPRLPQALSTDRLRLQPIGQADAADIQAAAADKSVADTMISLPHPYPAGEANRYIARQQTEARSGHAVTFVLRKRLNDDFVGIIELRAIEHEHSQAELSFWLATSAWRRGYMREALPAVVHFGFDSLALNRLYAYHMLRNPASGNILRSAGFQQEGLLRQRVRKWGRFEDVALWARLDQDDGDAPLHPTDAG